MRCRADAVGQCLGHRRERAVLVPQQADRLLGAEGVDGQGHQCAFIHCAARGGHRRRPDAVALFREQASEIGIGGLHAAVRQPQPVARQQAFGVVPRNGARSGNHQRPGQAIKQGRARSLRQCMARMHGQHQRIRTQRLEPQAFHRYGVIHAADHEVQHIGLELVDQVAVHAGAHFQPDFWIGRAKAQHGIGQHGRHHAGQRAEPDAFMRVRLVARHAAGGGVDIGQDAQRMLQEARARGGQLDRALPHEQPRAGQFFQLAQGLGNRWLGQPEPVRGAPQVLGLRHRHEAIEMPQPHTVTEDVLCGLLLPFHIENSSYSVNYSIYMTLGVP
ncbi:hypothetical protein AWV79_08665 [Cupriavidus sp. UYMMa02A]|nr:hypothetical protein AWV79_08665 [Cupriavidus sp. UYMMa02A]